MKTRAAIFVAAIIASILSSANAFAAPDDAEQRADTCLTSPRDYTPPGTRWRYRVERGSGRHCWYLKDDSEKSAGKAAKSADKAAEQTTAAAEEPAAAPPPRQKPAATRSLSDAHAEFSQAPVEQAKPDPAAPVTDGNQAPAAKSANNMLAPAAATRWPDAMSTTTQANPAANSPAPPAPAAEQNTEARPAPAPKPQVMPRAVPPMPASEKPISLPMLITIIVGGLSVLGVLVSLLFAWLASRKAALTASAPMPPIELSDAPRRPGDLYRERKRVRTHRNRRRAA